ncbi:MAG: hypothetical protein K5705_06170 [Oscillospiraceae bacterium]|nr:hypothetical protein [Oscillospiraceae bacterium]
MKRVIEYIRDVRWWLSHYEHGWWKDKHHRKTAFWNALYCTAPARWKRYNRFLKSIST